MTRPQAALEIYRRIPTPQALQARKWLQGAPRRVLEVGCSAGYFSAQLAEDGHAVWCADLSQEHLVAAHNAFPGLSPFRALMELLPCRSGALDAVVALEVLEHTRHDAEAVAETARLLRPGGELILTTPNKGAFAFLDPFNIKTGFSRTFPGGARGIKRLFGRFEGAQMTENIERHRHYSLDDMAQLLKPFFEIVRHCRTGLLFFPLASAGCSVLSRTVEAAWPRVALQRMMQLDGGITYGALGYNLMLLAKKR